jgi:glycosyltransferase involved in cell wall biosynthesis
LSLGRFVAKKNLAKLIRAYRKFLDLGQRKQTHLVMVGSGEEEAILRKLCDELRLPKYDHADNRMKSGTRMGTPGVHFYGFRQIEENPVFYALADAFILPSVYEEWGLVVNEAMACGLPVVVSKTAGCAEDLLEARGPREITKSEVAESLRKLGLQSLVHRNGFTFDPHSVEELSRVLVCLEANPELREAMGQASRRIIEKFSCQQFAKNALQAAKVAWGVRAPATVAPAV